MGNRTQYGYDTGGFVRTVTDPNGNVTTTEHDVRGNTISSKTCQDRPGNLCSTIFYTYSPDAMTKTLTPGPLNDVMLTTRDGRSTSATDDTYKTTYGYDTYGNRTTVTDPLGRVTTTAYTDGTTVAAADGGFAPAGLPMTVTTPGGAKQSVVYFHSGDVATVTDPAGKVTAFTYDGMGRVLTKKETTTAFPAGLTNSFTYHKSGLVKTQTSPRGDEPGHRRGPHHQNHPCVQCGRPGLFADGRGHHRRGRGQDHLLWLQLPRSAELHD